MSSADWQVVEGRGSQHLETIAGTIDAWNRWGQELPILEELSKSTEYVSEVSTINIINGWLAGNLSPNLDELALYLQDPAKDVFAVAALAKAAHQRVDQLKDGLPLHDTDKKAKIHVIGAGVIRSTGFVEPGHGLDVRGKFKPVKPGTVLEGKIRGFKSTPGTGGWMELSHGRGFLTSYVQGFVNPVSGRPQTKLEILKKTKKS